MALYQLIYQSRSIQTFDDQALGNLLEKARVFNIEYNITGILLYGAGMFMQLLEGEDDAIRSLYYLKIAGDPRHLQPRVIREGFIAQRLFQNWAMAFRPMNPQLFNEITGYVNPDKSSEYGRNLLYPLESMEGFRILAQDVQQKGK